jgi:hypothetical protein
MRRRTLIAGAAILLLALAAGWYVGSPWYTLGEMRAAARSDDADSFDSHVDFPALRADVKAQLGARIQAHVHGGGLGASLGAALGAALVGPLVDAAVSPAGVRAAFDARRENAAGGGASQPLVKLPRDPAIHRLGLSEFLLVSRAHPDSGLVFRRDGLGWKLSGVRLPAEEASPAP